MQYIENKNGSKITKNLINEIQINSSLLSEIDGAVGDGDHGINMNKGFSLASTRISEDDSLSNSFEIIGKTLLMDIGGSMGPIYGEFFLSLSKKTHNLKHINKHDFLHALNYSLESILSLTDVKVGDKTLVDTLYPSVKNYEMDVSTKSFKECMENLKKSAYEGKESTKNMIAKIGRAARLGERSKGHLDAGATSCYIILNSLANEIIESMKYE